MSILINNNTKLVVQGITGKEGVFHTRQMLDYGTQITAGVTPGKGGQKDENGIPIFNTVAESISNTDATRSRIEDADFAKEQMSMMKLQILQQTTVSSFSQANSAPQMVLSLFR